ncbi:hypothetical protein [Mycobacterium asiaticum]|uniref:hypothetical protein n=1 Tax=Mycobacterium asiaticum TaxID=1790 RepID=UPI000561E7BB|nr:hypothetical protein [Mycobacterium asiaticum]OBI94042.1 hypothetical protein A5661_23750 [Mycobacterium asiaticum]ORA16725.1 hypothetical protein BST16_05935 [Mycobacterium asiaticum DSM 44297]
MTGLLDSVFDAHGGLARWREVREVQATIVSGGKLFQLKGQPQDPTPRRMTAALHREWAALHPFGAPDQRTDFTPQRIAIETLDGRIVSERKNPRDSFAGHQLDTPWDPLQRAYFNGYAMWTYLNSPFLMALPGVTVTEIAPVEDRGQRWPGLQVRFPKTLASHCPLQEFYFDADRLLCRHDYRVDIAGGFAAIQYVSEMVRVDGFAFPTKRRAFRCGRDGRPMPDELMVSIDLSDYRVN